MPSLKSEEHKIYLQLIPLFVLHGYQALPEKKEFRQATANGYRTVILSVQGNSNNPRICLQLGVRFQLLESLVQQFLPSLEEEGPSVLLDANQRFPELLYTNRQNADSCYTHNIATLCRFMKIRGFRMLKAMDNIKRIDGLINRHPDQPTPYQSHPVHRCFRGLILARLTHRSRFKQLEQAYEKRLLALNLPAERIEAFRKLANFLQSFSFN